MVVLLDQEKRPPTPAPDETPLSAKLEDDSLECSTDRRRRRFQRFLLYCAMVCAFMVLYRSFDFGGHHGWNMGHYKPWHMEGDRDHHGHPASKRPPSKEDHLEKLFLSVPDPKMALAASRKYATIPHLAGSVQDYESARTMLEHFQTEFSVDTSSELPLFPAGTPESRNATLGITSLNGPNAWIDIYYPVLNTPLNRSLQILGDDGKPVWSADLVEHGDETDPEAARYADAVPTFHGYSKDGDVEGPLVFANYGTKEDFDLLVAAGVNFTGKIVLTRYGSNYRGLKIKAAEELGAIGLIMYSDPRDDGQVTVSNGYAPYPHGPARNPTSVQRGSVQYLSVYPSDPSTPGTPAYENATRVEGWNVPKIPSLPISFSNAERLLEEVGGIQEGRFLSGRVSETKVKLVNHADTKVTKIYNVMAAIPGHIKDEVVMVGNHRDAWVMGASDPTSGTASMHEVIRGFGVLLKQGWKPLRTIVFASWDAEEYGLIGSTEYGEDFGDWISSHVVSYLNVDISVSGSRWTAGASPSLSHLIHKTAQDVTHPTKPGKTLWDARDDDGPFEGIGDDEFMASYEASQHNARASGTGISPLGSGSDFTVFLQRLGIASMDQGFGFTPSDAAFHYHSIYDSQRWQELYADSGFHRHVAVAKHLGLMTLRLTDAIILPLNTTQYVLELYQYLDKVEKIASETSIKPDFSALRKAINNLQSASADLDEEKEEAEEEFKDLLHQLPGRHCPPRKFQRIAEWIKRLFGVHPHHDTHYPKHGFWMDVAFGNTKLKGDPRGPDLVRKHNSRHHEPGVPVRKLMKAAKRVRNANHKLAAFERGFISEGGIKDRVWYKHLGVAPGLWLGYGATTFPGLTEALSIHKNATLVDFEATRLTDLLEKLALKLRP